MERTEDTEQEKLSIQHGSCKQTVRAIHDTMDVIGGKWKISILGGLMFQPMRYSEILREVSGISGKMLSRELKELELNHLISRTVLNTQPITVEYRLTEQGETLKPLIQTIAKWGLDYRKQVFAK